MKEYQIYQLDDSPENRGIRFADYDTAIHERGEVTFGNYNFVYKGVAGDDLEPEDIFVKFNIDRPADFYGHSLTMSDIIVIFDEPNRGTAYYVNTFGFVEVPFAPTPEQQAKATEMEAYLPVYTKTRDQSREIGEYGMYRVSLKENIRCRNAIDSAIRENFDGMHLKTEFVRPLIEQFGKERVEWVMANTLKIRNYDTRFHRSNRNWSLVNEIPIDLNESGYPLNEEYAIQSHPAVADGFITRARKEIAQMDLEKNRQKGSIREAASPVREAIREKQAFVQENKSEKITKSKADLSLE